ncbi:hypothetical protein [Streptosporangium sp. NPDC048865]|uniref:hypothetical protein n=1 Tax=Streptosporangium sp. NPDC048865 TaxID=3155766 RepID=UPI00341AFE7C
MTTGRGAAHAASHTGGGVAPIPHPAIPSLIVFFLLREQLLDGLTAGAVKSKEPP